MKFATKKKFALGLNLKAKAENKNILNTATDVKSQVDHSSKLNNAVRVVYSKEIEFKAMPNLRFFQFATVKTELGTTPGLTIQMLTYDNVKLGGKLTEGVRINGQAMSTSMKSITVHEHGNAITVSQLLLVASFDDIMASATTLLARDYALVLDCALRDTALSGTNVVYARQANGSKTPSRAELTEGAKFTVATVKDAIEILATNNAPKYNNTNWICFVHPHQSRDLRDDKAWINASNYGAPEQLFTGEIGRIDDTRFIETTILCNGAAPEEDPAYKQELVKGQGSNKTHVYQSVLFGDNYYAVAFGLPVELRDNGIIDYGRERGLAWYSIFGTGILHNEYGVVIETA